MVTREPIELLVKQYIETIWHDHDVSDVLRFVTPGFRSHGPGPFEWEGPVSLIQYFQLMLATIPPEQRPRFTVKQMLTKGEYVVTHLEDPSPIPRAHGAVQGAREMGESDPGSPLRPSLDARFRAMLWIRVASGRITEQWVALEALRNAPGVDLLGPTA